MRAYFLFGVLGASAVAYLVFGPSRDQAPTARVATELAQIANNEVVTELAQVANGPLKEIVNAQLDGTKRQTAVEEAVVQYDLSQRRGNALDMCAHAHRVVAAFLEAQDQASYKIWKQRENVDCAKAGIPGP